ncbi:MAG: protein translocase subunit SecF [Candidatus Kapaibacteriales bacterium]
MQFFKKPNIDFVGKRFFFFVFSSVLVFVSLVLIIFVGFRFGIDFTGGTEIGLRLDKHVSTNEIRSKLAKSNIRPDEIKSFGEENQFLIRMKEVGEYSANVENELNRIFEDYGIQILKKDTIGPKIGKELRVQAFIAVILSIIAILIYIGLRFEFSFGIGAITALAHDVILTMGILILFDKLGVLNLEFNQGILAALLTVVGYSVNDTVIIFDRVRENRDKHKGESFIKIVNLSINETLSRTIITVITVALVLVVMVFFSGPVLQGFAFTMLVGIIVGTYSSIYIASSFVIWYLQKVKKLKMEDVVTKKPIMSKA